MGAVLAQGCQGPDISGDLGLTWSRGCPIFTGHLGDFPAAEPPGLPPRGAQSDPGLNRKARIPPFLPSGV